MPPDQLDVPASRGRIAALIARAGYSTDDPLVIGVRQGDSPSHFVVGGRTATGEPFTEGTVVYVASLSKQLTAACAALLVRRGRLDVESPLAQWMPELPAWAATVRVRHLIHHTSGLPEVAGFYELERQGVDRTTDRVFGELVRLDQLAGSPGAEYRYSNSGYVCLAAVIERAAGQPLKDFALAQVFRPLGMLDTRYWSGPERHPPGAAPVDPDSPAPLSPGDGGAWSTTRDLMRWNESLDRDELGISGLVQTRGHLDDGTELDYGWGLDVHTQGGERVYRHGGTWAGLTAHLVRIPARRLGLAIIALEYDEDRVAALADGLIDEFATQRPHLDPG